MPKPAILTVAAEEDVADQAGWIAAASPEAAARFIDAVAETIRFAAERPMAGVRYAVKAPSLRGLRKLQITGFENRLLFYLERDDSLLIVRILHGARDLPLALSD